MELRDKKARAEMAEIDHRRGSGLSVDVDNIDESISRGEVYFPSSSELVTARAEAPNRITRAPPRSRDDED